uniref:Uncharacterized protein n=1 Tax=Leptospirillum ferriphilum TaxID=178606 RepID=A0A2I2MDG6_9BACT
MIKFRVGHGAGTGYKGQRWDQDLFSGCWSRVQAPGVMVPVLLTYLVKIRRRTRIPTGKTLTDRCFG